MTAGERNCYLAAQEQIARYGWPAMLRAMHTLAVEEFRGQSEEFRRANWRRDVLSGLSRAVVGAEDAQSSRIT